MIIKMTRGFSLQPIAERLLASNRDLILMLPASKAIEGHPRCLFYGTKSDKGDAVPSQPEREADLIVAMLGERRHDQEDTPVFHFSTPGNHQLLGDKYLFAESLCSDPHYLQTIPVCKADEIKQAVEIIKSRAPAACIKPRRGVYGHGYWAFWEGDPIALLNDPDNRQISLHQYLAGAIESIIDHVVMPWLPGPEVTFDILAHEGQALAWCTRTKNADNSDQEINWQHPLQEHAAALVQKFNLNGIIGIQYRQDHLKEWKILEINDRPCGGVVKSEDAGAGLIEQWGGLMTGRLSPSHVEHRKVHGIMRSEKRTSYHPL